MSTDPQKKIKVLIIDDSALVRALVSKILSADEGIEVVGTAPDAYVARERIKSLNPDVLTLDVEMPRMDGLQFLRNLMRLHPMPVVMCSSLTERGADITLAALELGAIDFVTKPKIDVAHGLQAYANELIAKVKLASQARVRPLSASVAPGASKGGHIPFRTTEQVIGIGASTGGTEAIRQVLCRLPATAPGVVISQHIPRAFSGHFAERLNGCSVLTVCEAQDGQMILPGHAYVAPGDRHLVVERDGARYRCRVQDGAPVHHYRPSVDVMFGSMAANVGANAVGVILTGMGNDGARGLRQMRDSGAPTIAQDEKSSVVWGMPGAALAMGAVGQVVALEEIAEELLRVTEVKDQRRVAGS